jgi:EAL domain-containing protein (putative c-di-GMP-specific phosphodiesterase class I)
MLCVPITAEGVETESIRKQLLDAGCQDAQGWLFGRAVSAQFVRSHFNLPPVAPDDIDAPLQARVASGRKW